MHPMIPGRAAAALPAKLAQARPRACRCVFYPHLDPALVGWLLSRRRHWRTTQTGERKMPIAVRIDGDGLFAEECLNSLGQRLHGGAA